MLHPDTAICVAAMELARDHSPLFLFNHVMRTFAFGRGAGALPGARYDHEMLFVGSVLHDLGLVEKLIGAARVEIWDAIALHTTPGVPQRKQPEVALLQLGAGIDIGAVPLDLVTPESVEIILAEYPRLGFKAAMLEAMAVVVRRKPMTGAMNLMGEIGRERDHLPIPGFCDIVKHSAFAD